MGKGIFTVQVPQGPQVSVPWMTWEFEIPAGSGELKGQIQQLNQMFSGDSDSAVDLIFSQRSKAIHFFSAWESGEHLVLA